MISLTKKLFFFLAFDYHQQSCYSNICILNFKRQKLISTVPVETFFLIKPNQLFINHVFVPLFLQMKEKIAAAASVDDGKDDRSEEPNDIKTVTTNSHRQERLTRSSTKSSTK